jgi:ribosomal protein S18 acetylase RimI-like enzyme
MALDWHYSLEAVDWDELSELYRLAGLGDKRPEDLEKAFANSMYSCFLFDQGRLVGVGRALADGVDCSYICDVSVHPDYQGRGIGRDIVSRLLELSAGHRKIILYACPGKEDFYRKLGFRPMTTAMAIFENQEQALEQGFIRES